MAEFFKPTDVFIHVDTKEYPVTIQDIGRKHVIGFGLAISPDLIRSLGYDIVRRTQRPSGDVVVEVFPTQGADGWVQTYEVREFTEQENLARLQTKKDTAEYERKMVQEEILAQGCSFFFGEEHGVQHIQLRTIDRTNITGLSIKALRDPDHADVFCTLENNVIPIAPGKVHDLADAALKGYTSILAASWTMRDKIANAKRELDVPTRAAMHKLMKEAAESTAIIPEAPAGE